jgi:catalase
MTPPQNNNTNQAKDQDLAAATSQPQEALTDNLGHRISEDQNSLRAGVRGPTLMEDFHFREKLHHFDHERIPERVVHARGSGAHGFFQLHESLADYTTSQILTDTTLQTPVFVRFSTVAGSRGSADTARDVRGFAVRFYTPEGNWDIVGNNIPVFFIQDAIKFPDLIHAAKPEPHNEIPQAQTAHDTFWDFISLTPESMHMVMWIMSDRAIPRSFRTMEGFGVHTFRLINAKGESHFVKFHWKPVLGVHSLVWDEAQKIAGKDPDFHRRDLWEAIEQENFPQWELGVQLLAEGEEAKLDFDILDATKIWPEDLIPVKRIGKLTLNRNPDNFFAETEQIAFMTTNIVPGIDFTDDPLLQGRNFSYLDTQLSRLGSPNWPELPINRPISPISNYQRDGHMRYTIDPGRTSYEPNSLGGNTPHQVPAEEHGFVSYPEQVSGAKLRKRSESFGDHYGQAKLFWNSMSAPEKEHIAKALQFELSNVETRAVRQRMLMHLEQIKHVLAEQVAIALGEKAIPKPTDTNAAIPNGTADSTAETAVLAQAISETSASGGLQRTSGLSMEESPKNAIQGRKIAVLVSDGVMASQIESLKQNLLQKGAIAVIIAPHLGTIQGANGEEVTADRTFANSSSVLFDAVFVPDGATKLVDQGDAKLFIDEAYKHGKVIAAVGNGNALLNASEMGQLLKPSEKQQETQTTRGIITGTSQNASTVEKSFLDAIAQHRFWGREHVESISA